GRLKLREIDGQAAVLIWYDRPDHDAARLSKYHLVPVADPAALKAALTDALGVRGEVRKRREIYLWHNVRIHLDEVAGLGSFL
ncbi:class IV adenylate cyclase, partial [Enterococcus faecium]|uniref:class IV adenylate cyclase n=1 Tax=Enterococcus faecium TaxID=1352 RepID=UPI003F424C8B